MRKFALVGVAVVGMAALLIPMLVQSSSASACTPGMSPGFWKNHPEVWPVCNVPYSSALGVGPSITLMEALRARGGGENAFLRQSAASFLNALSITGYLSVESVQAAAAAAYDSGDFEYYKDYLEQFNNG